MKIAYFDCFSGISGDMVVGALIHAGASLENLRAGLKRFEGLPSSLRYEVSSVERSAIHGVKFNVLDAEGNPVDRVIEDHAIDVDSSSHHHHHEHEHHNHHHHHTLHSHDHHDHVERYDHHGTFAGIKSQITNSDLPERVKEQAIKIFEAIAVGEARVHDMQVEDVHFHEVGAYDSIADIVAVALCLDELGIDAVMTSPIPLGSGGMIRTQHGVMPLPAPATLEILKDYPVRMTSLPFELTTPTGAGIVRALSIGRLQGKDLQVLSTGFGAGTRELPDRPNLLRVVIGDLVEGPERETVVLVETNVDDMSPEAWPLAMERIMNAGALDVWLTPVLMKKGRPGHVLSILAEEAMQEKITDLIFRETTTIGVRTQRVQPKKLPRKELKIETEFGTVRMKQIETPDGVISRPEAEEVQRIAKEKNLPFSAVYEVLLSASKTEE